MKKSMRVFAALAGVLMAASLLGGCSMKGGSQGGAACGHIDRDENGLCDLCGDRLDENIGNGGGEGGGSHSSDVGTEGRANLLANAKHADPVSYGSVRSAAFDAYLGTVGSFSQELAVRALLAHRDGAGEENFAISPVSVYTALATASASADGTTREELLSALHTSEGALNANFSSFYRLLGGHLEGQRLGYVQLANSIWVDETCGAHVRDEALEKLSENFFCDTYSADFYLDNAAANKAVRDFVKEGTNGLIDRDFALEKNAVFALINTLYLRDVWNKFGNELVETAPKAFLTASGETKNVKRMQANYVAGQTAQGDGFDYFYAQTEHGYKLKVLLPNDGRTAEDVFTAENLALVNSAKDFAADDHDRKIHYFTRLVLPAFEADCDESLRSVLQDMGVRALFDENLCDLSALLDVRGVYCDDVRHAAKLKVDPRGIEGAAVTVVVAPGATGPDDYEYVYKDFCIDRSFAFLLTDSYDNILFAGAVKTV